MNRANIVLSGMIIFSCQYLVGMEVTGFKKSLHVEKNCYNGSLATAVHKADLEAVIQLCKAGADVDEMACDGTGDTPLQKAVLLRKKDKNNKVAQEIFHTLIEYGADPNKVLRFYVGSTVLFAAAGWGKLDVVQALLKEASANVNIQNELGQTPLMMAAFKGDIAICLALLEHGADLSLCDNEGKKAMDYALHGLAHYDACYHENLIKSTMFAYEPVCINRMGVEYNDEPFLQIVALLQNNEPTSKDEKTEIE